MALKKIKSGFFSRGVALARLTAEAATQAATHVAKEWVATEKDADSKAERLKVLLSSQTELVAREFGKLKGSVMKVGQLVSMYGEHLLPPEANEFLKKLQSESPPVEFAQLRKSLVRQLSKERLDELDISETPMAAASMGQVHIATRRSDGAKIAMKIQYPGVAKAIDTDLQTLKKVLSIAKLLPKGVDTTLIFAEINQMLHQEVDYKKELANTIEFHDFFESDTAVIIPKVFAEYSSSRVISTEFLEGVAVDCAEVQELSQARRNRLAASFFRVFLKELFELKAMQTDPHFGNYRIRIDTSSEAVSGQVNDQLILLDFGAVRRFSDLFLSRYRWLFAGAVTANREWIVRGGLELGFLEKGDPESLFTHFCELCELFGEPFMVDSYDWGKSDLPKRVIEKGKSMVFDFKLRAPPPEIIFLDRKLGGVFIFLSMLKANFNAKKLIAAYIPQL